MSALKLAPETIAAMAAAIAPLDTPERRDIYRRRDFPHAEHVKDLDKRYRWDLIAWSSFKVWTCYDQEGVTDKHIDSALRNIVAPL